MNELLNKLSSYNVFNYLLPGVVFAVLASGIIHYPILQHDLVVGAFLYYFIGLVISRFGSLVLEPILKWISFLRFAEYAEFVAASKKDSQVEVLSEANNMYRTFCSLLTLLLILKLCVQIVARYPFLKSYDATFSTVLLLILFLLSYRKQTAYITKRVTIALLDGTTPVVESKQVSDLKVESKKVGA